MNIIEAIRLDNLEEVKKAIAEGKDICFKNRADWTLLHSTPYDIKVREGFCVY